MSEVTIEDLRKRLELRHAGVHEIADLAEKQGNDDGARMLRAVVDQSLWDGYALAHDLINLACSFVSEAHGIDTKPKEALKSLNEALRNIQKSAQNFAEVAMTAKAEYMKTGIVVTSEMPKGDPPR